jgi:wyosine [tRNA(Phe)-imidazoG37] synthetase (radical SAM superfamily)
MAIQFKGHRIFIDIKETHKMMNQKFKRFINKPLVFQEHQKVSPIAATYKNDEIKSNEPMKWIYQDKRFLFPYDFPLRDYPFYIDVEPTNKCNLNCKMCPRTNITREIGSMDMELYKNIIDEVKGKGVAIRFVGFGEPLLHERITDMVEYASDAGITTFLSTNGLFLSEELMERLIKAGLCEIRFSAQGVDAEGYRNIRKADYGLFSEKVRTASKTRERLKSSLPQITLCTSVVDETKEQQEDFKKYWLQHVDKIIIDLTDFNWVLDHEEVKDILPKTSSTKTYKNCMDLVTKMVINWDGSVPLCCADVNGRDFGDVNNQTIYDIWHSDKLDHMREQVGRQTNHANFPVCKHCFSFTDRFDELKKEKKYSS